MEDRWEGGMGQMGLHLTPDGLKILQVSSNALSFRPGTSEGLASHRTQPGFREVEAEVDRAGIAEVLVRLRNGVADYDLGRDGALTSRGGGDAVAEHRARGARLIADMAANTNAVDRARVQLAIQVQGAKPTLDVSGLPMRIDRKALLGLANHADVAMISLAGFVDSRAPTFDNSAIDAATRSGTAEVMIVLRDPAHHIGLSKAEFQRRKAANTRAFEAVMSGIDVTRPFKDMSEFGAITARLTPQELKRLYASNDKRVLRVALNRPMGGTALATSTSAMNLAPYWNYDAPLYPNAGYQGAYPSVPGSLASPHVPINIVVFDSGVQKAHPMLAGKVVFEACFGTDFDNIIDGVLYGRFRSICPPGPGLTQTVDGDSPVTNVVGAGEPSPYRMQCARNGSGCSHGTHVAGIAAGKAPGHVGVAPAAKIISVQGFSFDLDRQAEPMWFPSDLLATLQAVLTYTDPNTQDNDYVINLSIGDSTLYRAPCTQGGIVGPQAPNQPTIEPFVVAIQQLRTRGIPVIAATGNDAGGFFNNYWTVTPLHTGVPEQRTYRAIRLETLAPH